MLKGCRIYEVSVGCSKNILEKSLDVMLWRVFLSSGDRAVTEMYRKLASPSYTRRMGSSDNMYEEERRYKLSLTELPECYVHPTI